MYYSSTPVLGTIVKYKAGTTATSPLIRQLLYNNSRHLSVLSTLCDARDGCAISKMMAGKVSSPITYRAHSAEEVRGTACGGYSKKLQRNGSNLPTALSGAAVKRESG